MGSADDDLRTGPGSIALLDRILEIAGFTTGRTTGCLAGDFLGSLSVCSLFGFIEIVGDIIDRVGELTEIGSELAEATRTGH